MTRPLTSTTGGSGRTAGPRACATDLNAQPVLSSLSTWGGRLTAGVCVSALALVPLSSVWGQGTRPPPADTVAVGELRIDRTEVTVARFDAFLRATGRTSTAEREGGGFEWGAGWERRRGWSFRAPSGQPARSDDPAAHVSWFEARDFCAWAQGRLPSRDEWARAAYTETRSSPPAPFVAGRTYPYPTGDSPQGANLVGDADGYPRHSPAGAMAAGVNGLHDMAGNLWEWLADARADDRLTAGGSWWYGASQTRLDGMQYKPAAFYAVYVGFRCVYPAN